MTTVASASLVTHSVDPSPVFDPRSKGTVGEGVGVRRVSKHGGEGRGDGERPLEVSLSFSLTGKKLGPG